MATTVTNDGTRVTLDMVGSTTGPVRVSWTERDVMLYALGVGAGLDQPGSELHFTTENSHGLALRAIPSFVTILAVGHRPPAMAGLDTGRFLHAEQRFELLGSLPVAGCGTVETMIEAAFDKGTGAILENVAMLRDDAGSPIARACSSIFVRGAGGFGGPRGAGGGAVSPPDRPADRRVRYRTRPDQALLYRLSGDRNPLHSDPHFARERGFERPILHGLATYGFACRALVAAAAGGDPARLVAMRGRFSKPVYPGATLTTEVWLDDGACTFRTLDDGGDIVIGSGSARLT